MTPRHPVTKRVGYLVQSFVSAVLLAILAGQFLPVWAMQFKVSQIGYHTSGQKIAYLEDVPEGEQVKIIVFDPKWKDRLEIFNGRKVFDVSKTFPVANENQSPGLKTIGVDFTDFAVSGQFELRVEGHPEVKPQAVDVSEYLYWDVLKPILKTFYYQRSGQTLEDRRRNFYYYDCYTDDELRVKAENAFGENVWDASGGWYDDGGFNKHVMTNAVAAARLLSLYESNAGAFQRFKMDYPSNENALSGVPDLLNESKVALNWMMGMQKRNGAVLGGVTGNAGKCEEREYFDLKERKVLDASPKDTAVSAAVLAMAGRVYKAKDLGYSVKSLMAAQQQWDYLAAHPVQAQDELLPRFWAAVELYITTGQPKYQQYIAKSFKGLPVQKLQLQSSPMLFQAYLDYALYAKDPQPEFTAQIRRQFSGEAEMAVRMLEGNPMTGGETQFGENSNYQLASRLDVLMAAYRLAATREDQARYRKAANLGVFYLFGLNPLGKSFISGVGTDAIRYVSMQRFNADALNGYLVSGPNNNPSDGVTPKDMGVYSYADLAQATSVNQISLQKTANLAFALGQLNTSFNYPSLNPLAEKAPIEPNKKNDGKKRNKYPSLN